MKRVLWFFEDVLEFLSYTWGLFLFVGVLISIGVGAAAITTQGFKDCHYVYVQTTPVNGAPAVERDWICR